jgi:hypothetical protein
MHEGEMNPEDRFWDLAEELLVTRMGVTRSTMMGFPCLRINGGFFATFDRRNGHTVVKLPAERVAELVATGAALPFAPAGRTFREWAAIPPSDSESWPGLVEEALSFVASLLEPGSGR